MTVSHSPASGYLATIDRDTCLRLLHERSVGRLAFSDRRGTDIMPVNYTLDGEDILIGTTAFGAIAKGTPGHQVAFEVDHVDEATHAAWSVVVRGHAVHLETFAPTGASPEAWADGPRSYVVRIHPESITGRQLPGYSPGVV